MADDLRNKHKRKTPDDEDDEKQLTTSKRAKIIKQDVVAVTRSAIKESHDSRTIHEKQQANIIQATSLLADLSWIVVRYTAGCNGYVRHEWDGDEESGYHVAHMAYDREEDVLYFVNANSNSEFIVSVHDTDMGLFVRGLICRLSDFPPYMALDATRDRLYLSAPDHLDNEDGLDVYHLNGQFVRPPRACTYGILKYHGIAVDQKDGRLFAFSNDIECPLHGSFSFVVAFLPYSLLLL